VARVGRSLTTFQSLGNRTEITACLVTLAGVRARTGDAPLAATLLGVAEAAIGTGISLEPADRAEYDHLVLTCAGSSATMTGR
jgi:hypothetical protein